MTNEAPSDDANHDAGSPLTTMSALSPDKALVFRITHIANVPWIVMHGLHSRSSATQDPNYVEIGNPDLIDKRQHWAVPVPPGGHLNDYVPFYFTPSSPMLYNIKTGWNGITKPSMSEIVILVSSLLTFAEAGIGFVFTDRHALLKTAIFFTSLADVGKLDWKHWRHPSKLEWVRDGLRDLVKVITEKRIHSIALPPLSCGNGGLEWAVVRREIEGELGALKDVEVLVFEPTDAYQNAPKRSGLEALTPARALVAELVRRYAVLGLDCTNLEVQKLAWFLHRGIKALSLPDPLDLRFVANKYGPYADRLRHLLDGLDGSYLHCEKRLSDAGPFDLIWFEDSRRAAVTECLHSDPAKRYIPALERAAGVIDGFESPLGMELLATVDWLLTESKVEPTKPAIKAALRQWPGGKAAAARKLKLFDDRLLDLALARLA